MAERMKSTEYRKLCREIHRTFGKALQMPFWESCSLADQIYFGRTTKEKLFENLHQCGDDELCIKEVF